MSEPIALEAVTAETFAPHIGTDFALTPEEEEKETDAPLALTLIEATPRGRAREGYRQPFSLVFSGPPGLALAQGTFALRHASLGQLSIFLVPIGADAERRTYEAVFN